MNQDSSASVRPSSESSSLAAVGGFEYTMYQLGDNTYFLQKDDYVQLSIARYF